MYDTIEQLNIWYKRMRHWRRDNRVFNKFLFTLTIRSLFSLLFVSLFHYDAHTYDGSHSWFGYHRSDNSTERISTNWKSKQNRKVFVVVVIVVDALTNANDTVSGLRFKLWFNIIHIPVVVVVGGGSVAAHKCKFYSRIDRWVYLLIALPRALYTQSVTILSAFGDSRVCLSLSVHTQRAHIRILQHQQSFTSSWCVAIVVVLILTHTQHTLTRTNRIYTFCGCDNFVLDVVYCSHTLSALSVSLGLSISHTKMCCAVIRLHDHTRW